MPRHLGRSDLTLFLSCCKLGEYLTDVDTQLSKSVVVWRPLPARLTDDLCRPSPVVSLSHGYRAQGQMAIINYLIRRAIRHWQLFLNLSLGIVLATVLLASAPLLVDTVLEIGLRHEILAANASDRNLHLQTYALTEAPVIEELDSQARYQLEKWVGDYLERTIFSVNSTWMIPWVDGEPLLSDRVNLSFHDGIKDQVEFVAGTWPAVTGVLTDTVPVVVGEPMARAYRLDVGDRLPISFKRDDAQPSRWLQVSGIIRPRNPSDAYWFVEVHPLHAQSDRQWSRRYSTILPAESFYRSVATLLPGAESSVTWNVQLTAGQLALARISDLRSRIATLKRDLHLGKLHIILATGLPELLTDFAAQAGAVRGPLYLLMAEIALLVLYYVVLVAALSVQQAEREFAVLRSRGASGGQILAIQAAEAVLIAAIAFLSGPVLAMVLLQGLTLYGPLTNVIPGDWTVYLTRASWLAAGLGTAVCIVGLLLPVGPVLRRSIVEHQQGLARPPRAPWWQRMYLDVILLLVGLVLLWRLHLYGGIVGGNAGRPQVDWLLLLSPLALLLGSATILLRVWPLVLRLSAHITARGRGLPAALAVWQVSRNPARGVLLVLLLTLAMSLGMLSTGLNATLDVSEHERAQYAVGGDVRFISNYSADLSSLADEPGVHMATSVARDLGTVDLGSFRFFPRFEVLAVDPPLLAKVGTFRDDFSSVPMERLLRQIVPDEDPADTFLPLPGRPSSLGIWMWSPKDHERSDPRHAVGSYVGESDLDRIELTGKLRTAHGEYFNVELEPPKPEACPFDCCSECCPGESGTGQSGSGSCGWRHFSGELPDLDASSYPLLLYSIWIQNRAISSRYGNFALADMEIAMDDVMVFDGGTGGAQIVESFEDPAKVWKVGQPNSHASHDTSTVHSGQASQWLTLDFKRPLELIALELAPADPDSELPVLVSPAFLDVAHLKVGDTASVWLHSAYIPVRVVGVAHYFPTMYEDLVSLEAGFLVISRDPLLARLNDSNLESVNANEVWLSTDGQVSISRVMALAHAVDKIWEVEAVRSAIKADPMALGLRSVTFYGYVLTSLLSIVGFVTYFYMSARRREMTYGVLRTMGLSPWQLYASLVVEQVVLIVSGLALGTLLGAILNSLVLPGLPITLGKLPPVPPFRPYGDWAAVLRIYLVLGGALLICLSVATVLLWRARIHRVLRIGEE